MTHKRNSKALPLFIITLVTGACAALQPPNASGPGPSGPPYPVILTEQSQRREAAVLAFNRIAQRSGPVNLTEGYLQPVTATIKSLPADPGTPLYLPKVGSNVEVDEEEAREALRRFINDWRVLIGSNPSQLSLIERVDRPDRTKIALYEQRAFRYPFSFNNQQIFNVSGSNEINSRELVTYVLPSKPGADSLEIHIAWEVTVSNAPFKTVYADALNDEIIAVR